MRLALVDVDALAPQIRAREVDLLHQLGVGGGHVVEGEDAVAELEEEVGAEGDEGPEGELWGGGVSLCARRGDGGEEREVWLLGEREVCVWLLGGGDGAETAGVGGRAGRTYDGDDFGLDEGGERHELEVEREVELVEDSCQHVQCAWYKLRGWREGGTYGGDQEADGDCLLCLRHGSWMLDARIDGEGSKECIIYGGERNRDRGTETEGHQGCCFLNFSLRRAVLGNCRFGTGVDGMGWGGRTWHVMMEG